MWIPIGHFDVFNEGRAAAAFSNAKLFAAFECLFPVGNPLGLSHQPDRVYVHNHLWARDLLLGRVS